MTDSDETPNPAPTPIARLIGEADQTYTGLAKRMSQWLGGGAKVQRQTVAHYAQEPIVRMPSPEMMRALAYALDVPPTLVLHLFALSHERHYRELMGIAEPTPPDRESQAHVLAERLDALDVDVRRRLLWALRAMVETAEAEAADVGVEAVSTEAAAGVGEAQESTGARLRRLGDRLLVDIGAAYTDESVREDAEAVIDLLARRRGNESREVDGSRSS